MEITIPSYNKELWLKDISKLAKRSGNGDFKNQDIDIHLPQSLDKHNASPVHVVTLACLVAKIKQDGCAEGRIMGSTSFINYLRDDLKFNERFSSSLPPSVDETNYDRILWKILKNHEQAYSIFISNNLQKRFFHDKDATAIQVVLDELYFNIADHSQAGNLAYSFITFIPDSETVSIAFCDFGIGIKNSLLQGRPDISERFIEHATKRGITAKTNGHNKGYGLDIVVSSVSNTGNHIKIVSGKELFDSDGELNYRTWNLDFDFPGTLIYFDIPIDSLDDNDSVDFEL